MSRVVLLGAGHAHLEVIRRAGAFTRRGFELVAIAPDDFWYSGLATGMLGGRYPPELDRIDVAALAARGGGTFRRDRATAIDPSQRTIHLEQGPPLSYDALSLNLGSVVPVDRIPGLSEHGHPVKPIRNLRAIRQELESRLRGADPVRLVVLGGGSTGCEVAANARTLADAVGGSLEITLLVPGDRILEGLPSRAAAGVADSLRRRGVRILNGSRVERVEPGAAIAADGRRVPFDLLVAAVGLAPPPLPRATGLPTVADGALLVNEYLHCPADPRIFGGGDCIAFSDRKLARIGVYAVRQAPVLAHNLLATLEGRPLRRFRPQRRFLLILNLGDGHGLATWGSLHWQGRLPFQLKDRIDRRFLAPTGSPNPFPSFPVPCRSCATRRFRRMNRRVAHDLRDDRFSRPIPIPPHPFPIRSPKTLPLHTRTPMPIPCNDCIEPRDRLS